MRRFFGRLSAIGVALAAGCVNVTVYQPLTSLQRPTVLDPQVPNFDGTRLLIRCVPGDYVKADDAQRLCRRLQTLFTNQGAIVETVVPRPGATPGETGEPAAPPDLVLELKTRLLHEENPTFLWIVSFATLSMVPAITEYTVAQDVSIRDRDGFQLAADSLQARFVRYTGAGLWAVNRALDLLVRPRSERLTEDTHEQDFSRDYYRQMSQLAFNARVRASVLRGFDEPPRAAATQDLPEPGN